MTLKDLMAEKGIHTRELSVKTGISMRSIENYRQGRRAPSLEAGLKIADALGVDPHTLTATENGTIRFVMAGDREVAEYDAKDRLTVIDADLCPLYLVRTGDIRGWLESRAIDSSRPNSRLLKRILRLKDSSDLGSVLAVSAAALTDNFWVKTGGSGQSYRDVAFTDDRYADTAFRGDSRAFDLPYSRTPELTNTGSFEKCWKRIDGEWFLVKSATAKSGFSETAVCELAKLLGFPAAEYRRFGDPKSSGIAVMSPNFADRAKCNFQPALALVPQEKEFDFEYNYKIFRDLSPEIGRQYADILFLDGLCMNVDRHIHNYGVLTDENTGKILSLAPNFDNNMALLYNDLSAGDPIEGFIRDYAAFFQTHFELKDRYPKAGEIREMVETAIETAFEQFKDVLDKKEIMNIPEFIVHSCQRITAS